MSFLDPLARGIEHFVYDRLCALSLLAPADRSHATGLDALASPLYERESRPDRR